MASVLRTTKEADGAGQTVDLALTTAKSVGQIAKLLADRQTDENLKRLYRRLQVHCVVIGDQINRVASVLSLGNELIVRVLQVFESLIAAGTTAHLDTTHGYPRQRALNRAWADMEDQNADARLQFARRCLNVGGSFGQTALQTYDETFSEWVVDVITEYSEDGTEWSVDERPRSKSRAEPSYAVWRAAQTVFKALADSAKCQCKTTHELGVRLCLGTYRTPELDDKNDFDMFLASNQYWQEVHVCTVRDNVVRFVVSPDDQSMLVKALCKQVEKMQKKINTRLELKVKGGLLYKLRSSELSSFQIDKKRPPVSLQDFIKEGPRLLTEKTKRILAVLLSYAVLHLHGTPWLQSTWDSSQVLFFQTSSAKIPIRPIIQAQLSNAHLHADEGRSKGPIALDDHSWGQHMNDLDPDDVDPDDIDPDDIEHPVPVLVTLAVMLMELYFATPVEVLARNRDIELPEGIDNCIWPLNMTVVFNKYKSEIPQNSQFYYVIGKCLNPNIWKDKSGQNMDDQTLRVTVYQEVVRPLEDELCDAYDFITIDELDKIAKSTDLGSWGQTVQQLTPASKYNAARFYDDEKASEAHSRAEIDSYLNWKTRYEDVYKKYINTYCLQDPPKSPVKIAVLDSGVDETHHNLNTGHIKLKRNWTSNKKTVCDSTGHGTFTASLIVDYAPDAELYIAKIADKDPCSPSIIAEAIKTAVDEWKVDIISMSFGYPTNKLAGYIDLENALRDAYRKNVLMFAAASNSGSNQDRAYPARDPNVICIHSTDADGNRSKFSPTALAREANIATVGEAVQSAWPVALCDTKANPHCMQIKSGTSYATPIAVGIAAFLLQYARIHLAKVAHKLKDKSKMQGVLIKIAEKTQRSIIRDDYDYIFLNLCPDNLFGKDKQFIDAVLKDLLTC